MSKIITCLSSLALFAALVSGAPSASAAAQPDLQMSGVSAGGVAGLLDLAPATQEKEPEVDKSKIRYGKLGDVDLKDKETRIGLVNSKKVYLEIPAYKTVVSEKVKRGSARWIQLMEQATNQFRETLEKVAQKKGLKLIVEVGGVSGVRTIDLTDAIVEAL